MYICRYSCSCDSSALALAFGRQLGGQFIVNKSPCNKIFFPAFECSKKNSIALILTDSAQWTLHADLGNTE